MNQISKRLLENAEQNMKQTLTLVRQLLEEDSVGIDDFGVIADIVEELDSVLQEQEEDEEEYVECKFCNKEVDATTAHLHKGQWVCEGCWDERLRITE